MGSLILIIAVATLVWLAVRAWTYETAKVGEKKAVQESTLADVCRVCHAEDCSLYWFYEYKFTGLAFVASVSETTPALFVLCPVHARAECLRVCRSIGKRGHWGVPGILIAPCYVVKNLWALKKRGSLLAKDVLHCLWCGVGLGWLRPIVFLVLLTVVLGVVTQLVG